ncbi:PLxRFG domain-containing protein [Acinetobacter schindleri]|uniref:PLxRFG domain-containing protein n=1 Tax=Acinetobacter schindleri TaxID=108981 RepID=UPI00160AF23F|nr:PLxRFG domain-containing protein [Acinetobacter schindleri]MBB4834926.1 hypothetical protein [Acinetobacter schindleri]WBX36751.1 PLxRFG domain-containing protein [Acinetobacter schindleri]
MSEQKKPWEQSWNQPAETSVSTQNKKPWEHNWNVSSEPEVEKSKGFGGHVRDIGASLAAGAASLPDVASGIGDILTGGAVGKTVEDSGLYTPGSGREYWADKKTDQAKAQSQKFSDAEGIIDKTKVALTNPTLITNTVAESLPTMVAGGLVGRGLSTATKGAISPMVGGAIGEGTMMAGSQAENIRQQTDDGLLTGNQVAASVATGALGTLFGLAGGAVAKKFGFGDIDSMLAGANAQQVAGEIAKVPLKQVPKHVVLGALSEGLLEELPQSAQEQVLQNYALNKDLMDGVDDAIVMGALAGMTMGGAASGLNVQGHNQRYNAQEQLKVEQQAAQQAQEAQAMRDAQSQLFSGDVPDPVFDPSKLNPFSDNAQPASPIIDMNRLEAADGNPRYDNGINFQAPNIETPLSLAEQSQTQAENSIDFERPEQGPTDLERQIQFNNTFGLETPDPVVDYNGISPFDNNPQKPVIDPQKVDLTPSEQMGLDPNLGPLSAAAATAVDSGISQQMQIEMQAQAAAEAISTPTGKTEDSNAPLQQAADAVRELTPEQIHGKQNTYGPEVTAAIERIKQQGVLSSGNTSEFLSANDGSQPNTEQIISTNDNGTGATAQQSAQDNAGQIAPPNQSPNEIQTSEAKSKLLDIHSKVTELEAQLVTEKSVPKKAQIRKQIAKLQQDNPIDQGAHAAATSIQNDLPEPTQAQIEAGNYKKGHIKVHGLDIAVENPRGSERRGTDPDGKEWAHTMSDHYGYIKKTTGADNEHIDTYIGRNPESEQIFVVDQIDQKTGGFDEHKVMMGFNSQEDAIKAYSSNFDEGWKVGPVRAMNKDEFKSWLKDGNTKKPADGTLTNEGTTQPQGKTEKVYTPGTNREIEVRHKVVEADSLITSNDANGAVNPNFPKHLQPRDRSRPTSIAQVHDIASKLNPKLLGENPSTASGAPIVSAEGVVESGNGRTMAIRKAYETGKGEAYKQWLGEQGYDVSGMKNPVLVRERTSSMTDQELRDYTRESNESSTLTMSPTEQAMVDAKAVVDLLDQYRGGDINSAANRDFVNRFVTELVPTSERGKMLSAGTGLTQDGQRRINAALVAAAYNDIFIVDQVFESTESDIKAIGNALTDVAGFWAKMRDMAINGQIPKDLDVTLNLVEAVHLVQKARVTSTKLADLVAQDDIFSGAVDPVTLDFLSVFYRGDKYTRARGRERVADALNHYAQQAMQQSNGENLFGDEPKNNTQLRGETLDRLDQQETDKQQDIFASPQPDDRNTVTSGGTGQRATTESSDAETQTTEVKSNSPEKPDSSKPAATKPKEVIQDFGEKIGGARKDTAVKTGKKPVAEKPKDDRPTWAKRFEISEIAASSNPAEVGKWTISDTKNKDWMGNNRRLTNQMFNSQEEAEKFLPVAAVAMKHRVTTDTKDGKKGYIIVRTVSDRKHVQVVQQLFDTRDAANEYLVRHAQEILETNTTFGELDLPRPENTQRTGVARREGDAKDSDFSRVFGFRGVEFGNWNNQAERQELLNDAFDGLMDLAEVLNIPPEALSLNGELALAFGARGQGLSSAKAHYESNRVVINLTKMNGAGSLAHEWWHAFDHYLSRQDGSASSAWIQHEDGSRSLNVKANPADRFASHGFKVVKSGVREDVRNNFEKLMVTMFKKSQAYIEDTQAADEFVARSRDEVQDKLNSIRENLTKQLDPQYYKRFNKPASADQLAEFDTAAELIITGQLLETEARKNPKSRSTFGGYRHTNDALDKINEIFKVVRGRSGFNADFKGVLDYLRGSMSRYMSRLKMLADAQQSTTKYKSVPTEFAMNAKELDQGRGSDYWTTPHEMSARAFQGYVEDKIAAKNARSPFLNYGPENVGILTPYGVKRPFPSGEERVAINQAFDDLIGGLQTEKTDTGSRLYSRAQDNVQSGQTPEQVREALVERFGEKTISSLERRGLLDIVSTVDEPGVEGFYQNGRVTLVASNLNETSIIPTFLHELGGHGGFQNVMSEEKYADLMGIFNDMVQRKHPLALEAKRLAERETDAKTQQLEYLPYLLTLASTQQEMNALQKSAIKRFIDKVVSAVKAWAFDRLGINLNLNENDMVTLANRMIQQQIAEPTSVENVRAQLQGTDQWMKAPNGQPTNLTEQQWLQVRTPEFKQWFGDWENSPETASKVVDENGEPQVVYHGTSSQFTRFKLGGGLLGRGVYLTDRYEEAQNYAGSRSQDNEGTVMPLFANIPEMFNSNSKTTREQIVDAMQDGFNGIRHQFNDMDYLVAFNPEQVKSAVGNTGLFSSQDTDIRFSRQANAQQIIQNLVGNMNKQGAAKLKTEAGYKATHALQYVLGALGRRQLTELYQKLLPQLKPYNDMVAMMDADQNEVAAMSDELARRWADLKDEKELANVMHDATLAKIDPAKPYQPGDNVAEYAKLKKQFDALSGDAKKVYREARDAYKKHHRDVRQAIQDRILRSSMSNQKKTELLQQMDANFFGYTQGVYFPLQRFGKYVVLVRDAKDQVISVSRAETLSEAHKLREILQGDYPNAKVHKPMLDKEYDAARDGVGRGFMTNLFNELGSFGLNAQRQAELEDILGQLYLKSLPDLSYAKHSVHRKGTAGFSQDARRAFAQNMFHGGSYLAKLRYKDQLEEMLDGMQKHASEQAKIDDDYEQPVAQQVIDEMNKRHKNMMEANSHPLSTALTSLGFLYYLGLSPASAAVNTLQTVLVAYPQMGAKWGYDKAGAALAQASNDFRKGVSIKGINPKNWENDIAKILKGDELKAYEEAVRRGVIDVTMAHDLAGIAQGEDSGVMWKLRPIMRVASTLFHNAERFNREVTFIAAYRLARDSGSMHDQAFEQAMDSTYKGHFDYSSGNRPRIMQGNIAKVILLFKQFGQNMIYTLARTAHQSLKGETPEARREAQRALAGIIGMHTVFAGVMGLPLVGPILAMASMLGSDDDEPWDAEAALRNALADALGTKTSEVLMKGASRFGPADLSGRVGINNLLLPDVQDGLEGKDFSDAMVMSALGPVVGILTNTFKGLAEIGQGHGMRGVETMSPVFLRSPLRSIRYATEGAQDKTGVMIKDDVGMFSLAAQAVGFSPSEVRLATEGRSAIYSHTKRLDKRRTELMNDYVRAVQRDDMDGQKEIWAEIQAFNQKNPSRRISRVQAMQSLRQREKRVKQAEHGIYLPNKKRDDADIGRFAFDE